MSKNTTSNRTQNTTQDKTENKTQNKTSNRATDTTDCGHNKVSDKYNNRLNFKKRAVTFNSIRLSHSPL